MELSSKGTQKKKIIKKQIATNKQTNKQTQNVSLTVGTKQREEGSE